MLGIRSTFALAAVLFFFGAVSAQTGGIKGRVKNLNGDAIAGAEITARQNGVNIKTTRADNKGNFEVTGLEPGAYSVVVDAAGYESGVKTGVQISPGKMRDLGDRLILTADRGAFVIVDGGIFFKDGTRLPGAEVKVERVNADGSVKKLSSFLSNNEGEFAFRQRPGVAKLRITATYNGRSATKDVDVDNAALYHLALQLDVERPKP